jgi:hypothetical protein
MKYADETEPISSAESRPVCISLFTSTDNVAWDKTYARPVKASALANE